jgi:hypothetical protein
MRQLTILLTLACLSFNVPTPAQDTPEKIAPAFRAERHYAAGVSYLERLAPGWTIRIDRADGSSLELAMGEAGLEATSLPASRLVEEGTTVVTPFGYRISVGPSVPKHIARAQYGIEVRAPNDNVTFLFDVGRQVLVLEPDGRLWDKPSHETSWRLPDGTRMDELYGYDEWEVVTIHGERFRLDTRTLRFEQQPSLSSPLLLADVSVPMLWGDGDDWVYPLGEDHVVSAWSWYPGPLSVDEIIAWVDAGPARQELNLFFNGLEFAQQPAEMAAYLLGSRLSLSGGDRVTFVPVEGEEVTVYLLPGPADPDTRLPQGYDPTDRFRLR